MGKTSESLLDAFKTDLVLGLSEQQCVINALHNIESRIEALENMQSVILKQIQVAGNIAVDHAEHIDALEQSKTVPVNAREWINLSEMNRFWICENGSVLLNPSQLTFIIMPRDIYIMPYHEGDTAPEAPESET